MWQLFMEINKVSILYNLLTSTEIPSWSCHCRNVLFHYRVFLSDYIWLIKSYKRILNFILIGFLYTITSISFYLSIQTFIVFFFCRTLQRTYKTTTSRGGICLFVVPKFCYSYMTVFILLVFLSFSGKIFLV